jgi:hypothetical protein
MFRRAASSESCRVGAASPRLSAPSSPQARDFRSGCASSSTPWWSGLPLSKRWPSAPGFRDRGKLSRPRQGLVSPGVCWIGLSPRQVVSCMFSLLRRERSQFYRQKPAPALRALERRSQPSAPLLWPSLPTPEQPEPLPRDQNMPATKNMSIAQNIYIDPTATGRPFRSEFGLSSRRFCEAKNTFMTENMSGQICHAHISPAGVATANSRFSSA